MSAFKCISCEGAQGELMYRDCVDYYLGKPYRADYWRCQGCSLVQQSPMPVDTSSFYGAYPIHMKKSLLYRVMRGIIMAPVYFQAREARKHSVILDYGCGDGWYLERSKGLGHELVGFEPNPEHAGRLAEHLGIPVFGDLGTLLASFEGKVDILTQHFVLEHLPDLHRTFETANRLLRQGGKYYIVVPEIDSWESRLFGEKWHNLDCPRHLSFPNGKVVRELADRHGFKLVREKALPFPNGFAGSIPVALFGYFNFGLFLLSLPLGILLSRLFPFGTRGYWLEKSDAAARSLNNPLRDSETLANR